MPKLRIKDLGRTVPVLSTIHIEEGLRAIHFKDGGQHLLQGLEKDICTQGDTLEIARVRFNLTVLSYRRLGVESWAKLDTAPDKFWLCIEGKPVPFWSFVRA